VITDQPAQKTEKRLSVQFDEWMATEHYPQTTRHCYIDWVRRFVIHAGKRDPRTIGNPEVRQFLTHLAVERHVTWKTQKQALCALVLFYDRFLKQPLGQLGQFGKASKPSRLPTVLSREEVRRVLAVITPPWQLMARLQYGAGLRLMDVCRLRVKDLDWERGVINVKQGKGALDAVVMLPEAVRTELRAHLDRNKARFDHAGDWVVHLPDALGTKLAGAEREWRWQYVFAAKSFSKDPQDGRLKIHHLDETNLQRAVKRSAELLGFEKRVTTHTLRHSFATHLIEAGVDVVKVKELLRHKKLETTMVYVHLARKPAETIKSPLDD
jgi:integron integrase